MRLKGKGINPEGNAKGTGDQYLKLQVKLPDEIDNEMMKFIREWSAENDYDVRDILRLI
jgi:DnaJ-class molecular chaperone